MLIYTFLIIIFVSIITIGMIFPIYRKVQLSKEETLKLFATFPRDKLEALISQMERIINSTIFLRTITDKEMHMKSNIRWKKRTIASTTRLPKFNLLTSLGCLVAFILISLYPAINYSLNHKYINQIKIFLENLSIVHKARGHSVFARSVLYARIAAEINSENTVIERIDVYLPTLIQDNADVVL